MADPDDHNQPEADQPTRLQRVACQGCAGLALTVVLVPLVLVIFFFAAMPKLGGGIVLDILFGEDRGAHTEIVVLNISGHNVMIDRIWFDEHHDWFDRPLEAKRDADPNQKSIHFQEIYFRRILPRQFPVEIRYTELDTGVERTASFTADRTPREECAFVMFLKPEGPELSDCRRSDLEDFD